LAKDYIIQKAVAPDKVIKKNRLTLEEYGRTHHAQTKNDGCCAVVTLRPDAPMLVQSRTGEVYSSMQHWEAQLRAAFGEQSLVLIGEAWWPGKDQFNLISGAFRNARPNEDLELVVNDAIKVEEFEAGYSDVPYDRRSARFAHLDIMHYPTTYKVAQWRCGTYGNPQDLCNELVDQGGYDGLILRDPRAGWRRGSGTEGGIIKLKRELSFDLRVLEVNTAVGEKTGRTVYKLVVDFQGKRLGVGSGLPHNEADVPKVGDIVEVCAMDYSSDGLLREPRYKGTRYDKIEPDA